VCVWLFSEGCFKFFLVILEDFTLGVKLSKIFILAQNVPFDNKMGKHKNVGLGNMVIQLGFEQCTS